MKKGECMDLLKKLQMACKNNDCQAAQEVLPHMQSNDIFHVLIFAVTQKKSDFVLTAQPYLSEDRKGDLFALAVECRCINMVRALLPYSDPKFSHSCALQMASAIQHQEIFDLLYPLSQPSKALKVMKKHSRSFECEMLENALEQSKIRESLHRAVKKSASKAKTGRKI